MPISYRDYLDALAGDRWRTDESGTADMAMPESAWQSMTPEQQMAAFGGPGVIGGGGGNGYMAGENSALFQRNQFDGNTGPLSVSQAKPTTGVIDPSLLRQDAETGMWVTPYSNFDQEWMGEQERAGGFFTGKEPWENILRGVAIVGGAGALGGAMGLGAEGLGAAGTAAEVSPYAMAGSDVEALANIGIPADGFGGISGMEGMGGIDGLTSAQSGLGFEGQSLFGPGGLAPEEMGLANYEAGAGLAGPGSSGLNLRDILNSARDILGGGGKPAGGGGILGGFGSAPQIGQHRVDNDPYGLSASGFGPWKGLIDSQKPKVADAVMNQQQIKPWG